MPIEVLMEIFSYLAPGDLKSAMAVNKQFYGFANANELWKVKFKNHFPHRIPQGRHIHLMSTFPKNLAEYTNSYILINKDLQYVKPDRTTEIVKIRNFDRFSSTLETINKDNAQKIYLSVGQEDLLITSNGDYIPPPIATKSDINWYVEFRDAYIEEYENLLPREKKLFSFLKEGDLENLNNIKFKLKDLNLKDQKGINLFNWVRIKNNQTLFNYIYDLAIEKYSNSDKTIDTKKTDQLNRTILHWAAFCNQSLSIDQLVLEGCDINAANAEGATPLYIASKDGHLDVIKALIEKSANIDAANTSGLTPLHIATRNGYLDVVNALIEKGANINATEARGITPLHMAAQNGHFDVVNALIEKGANINAARIDNGVTPLHISVENGHFDVVKALIEKGANINVAEDSGITPIHMAAQKGLLDVVNALIEKGANINAAAANGVTPLHFAAEKGHLAVVKALIEKGADINAAAANRGTPLNATNYPLEIIKTLRRQSLINYIKEREKEAAPDFKKSITMFNKKLTFGFSKQQKVAAAKAFLKVIDGEENVDSLKDHRDVLHNGELGSIYGNLVRVFTFNPQTRKIF